MTAAPPSTARTASTTSRSPVNTMTCRCAATSASSSSASGRRCSSVCAKQSSSSSGAPPPVGSSSRASSSRSISATWSRVPRESRSTSTTLPRAGRDDPDREVVADHRLAVAPARDARELARERRVQVRRDPLVRLAGGGGQLLARHARRVAARARAAPARFSPARAAARGRRDRPCPPRAPRCGRAARRAPRSTSLARRDRSLDRRRPRAGRPGGAPWSATWASKLARAPRGRRGQLVERAAVEQLLEPARGVGAALGLLAAGRSRPRPWRRTSPARRRGRRARCPRARAGGGAPLGVAQRLLGPRGRASAGAAASRPASPRRSASRWAPRTPGAWRTGAGSPRHASRAARRMRRPRRAARAAPPRPRRGPPPTRRPARSCSASAAS